jgi:hypothetical protein
MRFRLVLTGNRKIVTEYRECANSEEAMELAKVIAVEKDIKGFRFAKVVEVDENNRALPIRKKGSASPKMPSSVKGCAPQCTKAEAIARRNSGIPTEPRTRK